MKKTTTEAAVVPAPYQLTVLDTNTKNLLKALGCDQVRIKEMTKIVQDKMNELRDKNGAYTTIDMLVEASKLCVNAAELAVMCYKVGGYLESTKRNRNPLADLIGGLIIQQKERPAPDTKIAD